MIKISYFQNTFSYQGLMWPWRRVGWYDIYVIILPCMVSTASFNWVQHSLYFGMDKATKWYCALVSCTPSKSTVSGCAMFWCWLSLCVPLLSHRDGCDPSINMDNGKGQTFDPFSSNNSNSSKFYDIKDFVTTMPTERKDGASNKVGDMELNLTDTKPKLDNITQMQYMEASLSILREMAVKDGASLPQVLQYVGYLI